MIVADILKLLLKHYFNGRHFETIVIAYGREIL